MKNLYLMAVACMFSTVSSIPFFIAPAHASELGSCIKNQALMAARSNPGKNIMVFNATKSYSFNVRKFQTSSCAGVPIRIWVFKRGVFVNKDAAGYETWAFVGNCTRSGDGGKVVSCR